MAPRQGAPIRVAALLRRRLPQELPRAGEAVRRRCLRAYRAALDRHLGLRGR